MNIYPAQEDTGRADKALDTLYPSKDWVIADFIVTDYGAKAEPGFDNRDAFQQAIDAAYHAGGGVVYIPAGHYAFTSTQTGEKQVKFGTATQQYTYDYVLKLLPGVQLRGDWANPEQHNGRVLGTVLEVRTGKDAPNANKSVDSTWHDPQANNVERTTTTSVADRFIEMNECTGVTNLSIWYPEQDIHDIKPYPWTLFQTGGDSVTVENVTLVNTYNGFYAAPGELHYILHSYITALRTGIEVHICTDIGRIEQVKINPKYWAESGLTGAPSLEEAAAYTKTHGSGFKMHRSDWEYVSFLYVSGYRTGMWVGREPGYSDSPNAQFYEIHMEDCETGLFIEDVNPYGLLISNSTLAVNGSNANAVYFHSDFHTSVQFNGVDFYGPIVSDGSDGVISFESCTFDGCGEYALTLNSGNVLLTQSEFKKESGHVYLVRRVNTLASLNAGFGAMPENRLLEVTDESASAIQKIVTNHEDVFEPIPKNIITDIEKHPKPASNYVWKVNLPKAEGFNNERPTIDVSCALQAALDRAMQAGGGTVYLPAGRYLVNNPIVIPSGVELRGSWDVPHHTQGGGTGLFTAYTGGDNGAAGPSLIQLQEGAGIRGLTILQTNLFADGSDINNPRETPFLIQGQGRRVYIINVTIPIGDKGIDLATHDTSGHYVDYLAGAVMRAGIWVGGGVKDGFIRNMQFNPHYATRFPAGIQGYSTVPERSRVLFRYIQGNCSALKFADVSNQTIFNNFVFGSVNGIHFLKDAVTGRDPGAMTVIGHGSDGCTYALFVEDADENTRIVAINSELVNTHIPSQPVRSYVRMGDSVPTANVHPDAQLILYNSAFWGSPVVGAIIHNGRVRFQQANFTVHGNPGVDVRGGSAQIYTSYFAQENAEGNDYTRLRDAGVAIKLANNYFNDQEG